MSIDNPWNLDPVNPGSNTSVNSVFIGEMMQPSGVNNGMRQIASFLAQATSYKSADISASVSTNICATGTGYYMDVAGSGAINSYGSPAGAEQPNAAPFRILQFDSSASVSHGANIKLIGSVSRKMQPGDVSGVIHEGSGVWREFCFARADGNLPMDSLSVTTITNRSMSTSAISTVTLSAASASITAIGITALNSVNSISASVGNFTLLKVGGHGTLAQVVYDSEATYTTLDTILPLDNSIPQNTEGDEILTVTITPTNASSLLEIKFSGSFGSSSARCSAALFVDSTAAALNANGATISNTGQMNTIAFNHVLTAGSTTARTYKIRAGSDVATDCFLNGDSVSRQYGGIAAAFLIVTEILPQ